MKTKIILHLLAASALLISTGTTPAQPAPGFNGTGGLSSSSPNPFEGASIDPTTGLPINAVAEPWKDAEWKDPGKTLKEVDYDGLPIGEIARDLEKQFTNAFDILLPHYLETSPGEETHDWLNTPVHLRLKNVTASEIFNAMNLLFENSRTQLRWVLKMNGHRQVALLRIMQPPVRMEYGTDRRPLRKVIFVGDLMRDGMTMQQIIDTVTEVYRMSYERPMEGVKFHKEAQLIIVTGTSEQMELIAQTLTGMKQKIGLDRSRASESSSGGGGGGSFGKPPESKPAPEYLKPKSPK